MTQRENWLSRIAAVKSEGRIPIIAEIKPSSPSVGDLLCNRNIEEVVSAYVSGGAACVSVITGRWFGGDISMLSEVAQATSLPILRKDLIVNLEQVKQSRDHGANAVLLTKKILRKSHLMKMIDLCLTLNMTPFIEVSNIDEINEFSVNSDTIVAITNRDIAQKETDISSGFNSLKLLDRISDKAGAIISASGISSATEAQTLYQAGFDGLLVGTALLQADNPAEAVRSFTCI